MFPHLCARCTSSCPSRQRRMRSLSGLSAANRRASPAPSGRCADVERKCMPRAGCLPLWVDRTTRGQSRNRRGLHRTPAAERLLCTPVQNEIPRPVWVQASNRPSATPFIHMATTTSDGMTCSRRALRTNAVSSGISTTHSRNLAPTASASAAHI